jgi:putative oxidoreductase
MKGILDWILSRNSIEKTGVLESIGLLLFRASMGLMLAFGHGLAKLASYSARAANFPDPLGVGSPFSLILVIFAEFFCSLALVLGLFTRGVVIPLMINMSVAGLVIHAADPFRRKETALLFLASFIALFFIGPGKFSLDRLFMRRQ